MDYSEVLEKAKQKRDYFYNMQFFQIAGDYTTLITVIENLQHELDEKNAILNQTKKIEEIPVTNEQSE